MVTNYVVTGMTCHHCALNIEDEILTINDVSEAHVDFTKGTLEVTSKNPVAFEDIQAAVTEAGDDYAVAAA